MKMRTVKKVDEKSLGQATKKQIQGTAKFMRTQKGSGRMGEHIKNIRIR
jgi:ABC-type taurine transport system substrate-binding protein